MSGNEKLLEILFYSPNTQFTSIRSLYEQVKKRKYARAVKSVLSIKILNLKIIKIHFMNKNKLIKV